MNYEMASDKAGLIQTKGKWRNQQNVRILIDLKSITVVNAMKTD